MNFEEALEKIAKEYNVRRMYENYAQIEPDELFDDYNFIFIGVRYYDGRVLLTDNADYAELVDYDHYEKEIIKLTKKHHLCFNNYNIEKDYHDNSDVEAYLEFLYDLRDNYSNEVLRERK